MAAESTALALPPAAEPVRPRVLFVGTALAAAGWWMGIASMLGLYLSTRAEVLAAKEPWLPDGAYFPLTPGNLAMFTLAFSALAVLWAVDAVRNDDRPMAYLALAITVLLGVATINLYAWMWKNMSIPVSTRAGLLIMTITGAHVAMIICGLVFVAVMIFRTLGGEYSGRDREGLVSAALFWFATILAFVPIWIGVFIAK